MEFKFNIRNRVKIPISVLDRIMIQYTKEIWFCKFLNEFYTKTGLRATSHRRNVNGFNQVVYYFQVTDPHKYMLAKIKYGF